MKYDCKWLWGILVGIALSVLVFIGHSQIVEFINGGLCPGRTTSTAKWEGYVSKKDGISYCFEKTTEFPHRAIYRGIIAVD